MIVICAQYKLILFLFVYNGYFVNYFKMSDTGSGATTGGTNLSPSSTHHVKQLLATYAKNAPLSLTGPSAIEEQSRFNSKYTKFKLNNDVSLSKVYPSDNVERSNGAINKDGSSNNFESNGGQVFDHLNKQIMIQMS